MDITHNPWFNRFIYPIDFRLVTPSLRRLRDVILKILMGEGIQECTHAIERSPEVALSFDLLI